MIEVNVLGSPSPSVSLLACRSSSRSGLASSSWPIFSSSVASMLIENSVRASQTPHISLCPCSSSSNSGLASSSLPMCLSSWPMLESSAEFPLLAAGSRPSAARP